MIPAYSLQHYTTLQYTMLHTKSSQRNIPSYSPAQLSNVVEWKLICSPQLIEFLGDRGWHYVDFILDVCELLSLNM